MHELKQEIAKSTGPAVCDRGLQTKLLIHDVAWCGWMMPYIYIYDLPRNSWHFGGLFVDIVE